MRRSRPISVYRTRAWTLAACLLLAAAPAGRALGQEAPGGERRYTFGFMGVPLESALGALLEAGGIDLVYASDVVAGQTTYCRARALEAEPLLSCVLRGTDVDYVRLSSGTYVLVRRALVEHLTSMQGRVVDAETGVPLPGAHVTLAGRAGGTVTNGDGRFVLAHLRPGVHRVRVSHVAYRTTEREARADDHVDVALSPRVHQASPVVVSEAAQPFAVPLDAVDPRALRDAAPTPDLVRALAGVSGVHVGTGLADVHVQGGGAGAQLTRLDGVPIFMPVVHGGLVGPFSPFAATRVTVHKAGYGAAQGSGLAGVVEIEQAPGPEAGRRLVGRLDPLSANVRWGDRRGRADGLEVRWMVALRHGLWDVYEPERLQRVFRAWAMPDPLVLQRLVPDAPVPATRDGDGRLEVGFDDAHAAALVRLGPLRTLRASAYRGGGRFGIDDPPPAASTDDDAFEDAYRWTNRSARLGYAWVAGRRVLARVDVWGSAYRLVHPAGLSAPGRTSNRLRQGGAEAAVDLALAPGYLLSGGVEATLASSAFTLPLDPLGAVPATDAAVDPVEAIVAAWLEQRMPLGRATATAGMRVTFVPETGRAYAEPRLAVERAEPAAAWRWRLALGLYRQYVHAFDVATYNVTALLPQVRLWMPVGARQRPPLAYHAAASVQRRLGTRWAVDAEAYYKRRPHTLVLDYGQPAASRPMRSASGWGAGAGLGIGYAAPRAHARASYSLDAGRRRIANRFDGRALPLPWIAPHRAQVALDVRPSPGWTATVHWLVAQGRAWGFRQAYYDALVPAGVTRIGAYDLSTPEQHRLPVVHRLDLALSWRRDVGAAEVQVGVRVENVLGRRNVQDWWLETLGDGTAVRRARLAPGRLPSIWVRGRL